MGKERTCLDLQDSNQREIPHRMVRFGLEPCVTANSVTPFSILLGAAMGLEGSPGNFPTLYSVHLPRLHGLVSWPQRGSQTDKSSRVSFINPPGPAPFLPRLWLHWSHAHMSQSQPGGGKESTLYSRSGSNHATPKQTETYSNKFNVQFLCPMLNSRLVLGKEEDSGDQNKEAEAGMSPALLASSQGLCKVCFSLLQLLYLPGKKL